MNASRLIESLRKSRIINAHRDPLSRAHPEMLKGGRKIFWSKNEKKKKRPLLGQRQVELKNDTLR